MQYIQTNRNLLEPLLYYNLCNVVAFRLDGKQSSSSHTVEPPREKPLAHPTSYASTVRRTDPVPVGTPPGKPGQSSDSYAAVLKRLGGPQGGDPMSMSSGKGDDSGEHCRLAPPF